MELLANQVKLNVEGIGDLKLSYVNTWNTVKAYVTKKTGIAPEKQTLHSFGKVLKPSQEIDYFSTMHKIYVDIEGETMTNLKITLPDGKIKEIKAQRCSTYADIMKLLAPEGYNIDDMMLIYDNGNVVEYTNTIFKEGITNQVNMVLCSSFKTLKVSFKEKIFEVPVKNGRDCFGNVMSDLSKLTKITDPDILLVRSIPADLKSIKAEDFSISSKIASILKPDKIIYMVECHLTSLIRVFAKDLGGRIHNLHVLPNIKIDTLKGIIQDITGIPPDQQRLVFVGRQLEDEKTLDYYKVKDESTVYIILRLRGC